MKPKWFHGYYWLILLSLILYVPLIFLGGFGTSDDLSLVAHIGTDYWQDLKYSLSRSGHVSRPIYGLIQTTTLHLFGSSYVLYNIPSPFLPLPSFLMRCKLGTYCPFYFFFWRSGQLKIKMAQIPRVFI